MRVCYTSCYKARLPRFKVPDARIKKRVNLSGNPFLRN
jgi:hypothetical protein